VAVEAGGVAAIAAAVVAAVAVAAASANTKIVKKTQALGLRLCLSNHKSPDQNFDYTNSTFGLWGMMPALYPMSRSFTTASLPSSP